MSTFEHAAEHESDGAEFMAALKGGEPRRLDDSCGECGADVGQPCGRYCTGEVLKLR